MEPSLGTWDATHDNLTLRWPFNDYLGICDMWRLPKNAYFLLQSAMDRDPWCTSSAIGLGPEQEGKTRPIRVYSNCDTVELLLNGKSLGVHQPASQERVWEDFRVGSEKLFEPRVLE